MTYAIFNLFFMKIPGDDYYYLGEYKPEYGRVYIPTLNKSYAKTEVVFCGQLTDEYVASVKGPNKKVKFEPDEWGNVELYSRRELNNGDIRKLEKDKNTIKAPPKKDDRFFR